MALRYGGDALAEWSVAVLLRRAAAAILPQATSPAVPKVCSHSRDGA